MPLLRLLLRRRLVDRPMNPDHPMTPRLWLRPTMATLLLLTLGACASSAGLRPQGRLLGADELHSAQALAGVSLSPAGWPRRDWWRDLGDPALNGLIEEGLRGNPSLAAAEARLRQAQAEAQAGDAARKPNLSVSGGYSGLQLPESMVGPSFGGSYAGSAQLRLDLSYDVDLWGGKRAAWEAAVDRMHAVQVETQAARLELSAAIVEAYAQFDQAWRLADLADAELQRSQQLLELTRQRRSAGLDSDLQLRQAEARVPAAQQQRLSARQQIEAGRNALAALLGQGPDRGLTIARPVLPLAPPALQLPSVLPADLLGRRPEVVAARWRVEAADRQIAAARTAFYPSLNLAALAGVVNRDLGQLLTNDSLFGVVAPALSLPIFDGGRLRANLASKDAHYDLAVADYNQKVIAALREVADQVSAMRALQQQLGAQSQALDSANAAQGLAQQRYRAGLGSYLEVLSVQQQVLAAQQQMALLRSQQILASARLQRALGGGFTPSAAAAGLADGDVSPDPAHS